MFSHYLAGSILAFIVANTLAAGVKFAGVNIAGADFGCVIDVCLTKTLLCSTPPLTVDNRELAL